MGRIDSCNRSAQSNAKPSLSSHRFPLAMGAREPVNRRLLRKDEQNVEMQGTDPVTCLPLMSED